MVVTTILVMYPLNAFSLFHSLGAVFEIEAVLQHNDNLFLFRYLISPKPTSVSCRGLTFMEMQTGANANETAGDKYAM